MSSVTEELSRLGISALKSLGQNFLHNDHSLQGAEELMERAPLLEIGPGLGMVTQYFLKRGFPMILCEKDRTLAARARETYSGTPVYEADFLEIPVETFEREGVVQIVSNLPFYITSPVLIRVMRDMPFIRRGLFGMQKEVAERIAHGRGSSLAIFTAVTGRARVFRKLPRTAFFPVPGVDALWLYWERHENNIDMREFEVLLRAAFWGKRKSLYNALRKNPHWSQRPGWLSCVEGMHAKGDPLLEKRADALSVDDFISLYHYLRDCSR